jgi:AraC-like DNA-binding protein
MYACTLLKDEGIVFPAPLVPYIRMADYAVRTPWQTSERRLLDYLLIYVQEGECTITHEGVAYAVPPGSVCLIQPNELHTLQGRSNTITPFAHFDIFYHAQRHESFVTRGFMTDLTEFNAYMQPRLNDIDGIAIPPVFAPTDVNRFRETMMKMIGSWQQRDVLRQLMSQHYAMELVLALLEQFSTLATPRITQPESLNWITAYCAFHLAEPLRVRDLAERAHLSQSHFSALFRQRFGMSPHQYLIHLRIQRAQELLRTTPHSLAYIAEQCGFADVHHLAKTFKRMNGISPGAYRGRLPD